MDETNQKMLNQIKTSSTAIDSYPLIISLKDFLLQRNPNIYDFSNWLNFTLFILSKSKISFPEFLSKITFIRENEELSTELFKKINLLSKSTPSLINLIQENCLGPNMFYNS